MDEIGSSDIWRGRTVRYAPLLFLIGFIFFASSSQGAMDETSRFVRPLLELLFPNTSEQTLAAYHKVIRKSAHLIEYALLGFFASRAFWTSGREFLKRSWHVAAILLTIGVAGFDELNQSFISSRTGSINDVILDSIGGGMIVVALVVYKKWRNN